MTTAICTSDVRCEPLPLWRRAFQHGLAPLIRTKELEFAQIALEDGLVGVDRLLSELLDDYGRRADAMLGWGGTLELQHWVGHTPAREVRQLLLREVRRELGGRSSLEDELAGPEIDPLELDDEEDLEAIEAATPAA